MIPPRYRFSGVALREARKARGMSLHQVVSQLAKWGLPCTVESLRRYELGIAEPRVTLIFRVAYVLRRTPEHFMRDPDSLSEV